MAPNGGSSSCGDQSCAGGPWRGVSPVNKSLGSVSSRGRLPTVLPLEAEPLLGHLQLQRLQRVAPGGPDLFLSSSSCSCLGPSGRSIFHLVSLLRSVVCGLLTSPTSRTAPRLTAGGKTPREWPPVQPPVITGSTYPGFLRAHPWKILVQPSEKKTGDCFHFMMRKLKTSVLAS